MTSVSRTVGSRYARSAIDRGVARVRGWASRVHVLLYNSADPSFHGQFTYGLSDLFSFSASVEADPFGDPVLTALALETTFVDSALAGAPEIVRVTSLAAGGAQTPVLFKFFPLLLTVGDVTTGGGS